MPYLHLDLPGTYPVQAKREWATRLCKLYAEVMETQLWRPNVGIAELGKGQARCDGGEGAVGGQGDSMKKVRSFENADTCKEQ